jgi:hypothetical protein
MRSVEEFYELTNLTHTSKESFKSMTPVS